MAMGETCNNKTYEMEVQQRRNAFVCYFVSEFEHKLNIYDMVLKGKLQKPGKCADTFSEIVGQGVGGAFGAMLGIPFGAPVSGAQAGSRAGAIGGKKMGVILGNREHGKKILKLIQLINHSQENKKNFRKILVEAAVDVFQSFEMQFARISSKKGPEHVLGKIAEDAVNRAIDYWEEVSERSIAECVLWGKSKRKSIMSLVPGFQVTYCFEDCVKKWNSSKLFECAVLVKHGETIEYFRKKTSGSQTDEYGYRRLLSIESWEKLEAEYEHDNVTTIEFQNYQYVLDPKNVKQDSEVLLGVINTKDKDLGEERLMKLICDVKDDILGEVKCLEEISLDNKRNFDILKFIEETLEDLKTDDLAKHIQTISSKQNTVVELVELSRNQNFTAFSQLNQNQEQYHESASNERQEICNSLTRIEANLELLNSTQQTETKFKIWFRITEPVKSFTGRENELTIIHNSLQDAQRQVVISQIVSVHGLGGIGKSELARKYAYVYKDFYDNNVVWINSESQEALINSFTELARELKIENVQRNISDIVKDVYCALKVVKSLFIFDNAEEYHDVKNFLPSSIHPDYFKPHVLITSRNKDWNVGVEGDINVVPLNDFTLQEAVHFLQEELQMISLGNDTEELALTLHCFPLALQQAVAYIKEKDEEMNITGTSSFGLKDYIQEYTKIGKPALLGYVQNYGAERYCETVFTTWKITFDSIAQKGICGKRALKIIHCMAYLAPDGIGIERFFVSEMKKVELCDALKLLSKYSLIQVQKGIASIHRLIQEVVRLELQQKGEEEIIVKTILEMLQRDKNLWRDRIHIICVWNYVCKYNSLMKRYISEDVEHFTETILPLLVESSDIQVLKDVCTYIRCYTEASLTQAINKSLAHCAVMIPGDFKERLSLVRDLVKEIIEDCSLPEVVCSTPLHLAAQCGHLSVIKLLLKDSTTVALIKDENGDTPLHLAARSGHLDVIKYLIDEKGAFASVPDKGGRFPLHCAALNGHLNVIKYLVEEQHVPVNIKDKRDHTPAHCAALFGHLDTLKYLVDRGADCFALSDVGCTTVHMASYYGYVNVIKYLVEEKHVDCLAQNRTGGTALHFASAHGGLSAIKYLVGEQHAKYDVATTSGATSLYCAAENGHTEIVKYFIDVAGANPTITDDVGNTPLHAAAANGHLLTVKYLVGDVDMPRDIKNEKGNTPLHYAAHNGHLDIIHYLVGEKAASVTVQDKDGKMPLHFAAQNNHLEVLEYLLHKGTTDA